MINIITLVGRITKDPELRKTQTNKSVLQFTLAVDDYVNKQKNTYYHDCVVWEQGAEYLAQYAKKGNLIGVIGKLTHRDYTAKDGHKVRVTEVVASKVQLLSTNKKEEVQETKFTEPSFFNSEPKKPNDIVIDSDDLPFF